MISSKLEYELTKEDYKNASIEHIVKQLKKRFFIIFIYPFIISFFIAGNPFDWKMFLFSFAVTLFAIILLLSAKDILNIYKTPKLIKINHLYVGLKSISLEEDGIIAGKEKPTKYEWSSICKLEDLPSYMVIILSNNTSLLINKRELKKEEIYNFIRKIESNLSRKI